MSAFGTPSVRAAAFCSALEHVNCTATRSVSSDDFHQDWFELVDVFFDAQNGAGPDTRLDLRGKISF